MTTAKDESLLRLLEMLCMGGGLDPNLFPITDKVDLEPKPTNPGYGYRFLKDDEVIEAGDEVRGSYGEKYGGNYKDWCNVGCVAGLKASNYKDTNFAFRRKIDPGEGYRLLNIGEHLTAGDEYTGDGKVWHVSVACVGDSSKVGDNHLPYRRKIDTKEYFDLVERDLMQSGDETLLSNGNWAPINLIGTKPIYVKGIGHCRRAYDPKVNNEDGWKQYNDPNYRLLNVGETVKDGDEIWDHCGDGKLIYRWRKAVHSVGFPLCLDEGYRRPIVNDIDPTTRIKDLERKVDKLTKENEELKTKLDKITNKVPLEEQKTTASVGNGYRMLERHEILQPTDEFYDTYDYVWLKTFATGETVNDGGAALYRRKIRIQSPRYRYLDNGETILPTDETLMWSDWTRASCSGKKVGDKGAKFHGDVGYRRKIEE